MGPPFSKPSETSSTPEKTSNKPNKKNKLVKRPWNCCAEIYYFPFHVGFASSLLFSHTNYTCRSTKAAAITTVQRMEIAVRVGI
jgi:hypothetical protein